MPTPPKPVQFDDPNVNAALSILARQVLALDIKFRARGRGTHATLRGHARMLGCSVAQLRYALKQLSDAGVHTAAWQPDWVQRFETRHEHQNLRKVNVRTFAIVDEADRAGRLVTPSWLSAWALERLAVKARHGGARRGVRATVPAPEQTTTPSVVGNKPTLGIESAPVLVSGASRAESRRERPSKFPGNFQVSQPNESFSSFLTCKNSPPGFPSENPPPNFYSACGADHFSSRTRQESDQEPEENSTMNPASKRLPTPKETRPRQSFAAEMRNVPANDTEAIREAVGFLGRTASTAQVRAYLARSDGYQRAFKPGALLMLITAAVAGLETECPF